MGPSKHCTNLPWKFGYGLCTFIYIREYTGDIIHKHPNSYPYFITKDKTQVNVDLIEKQHPHKQFAPII